MIALTLDGISYDIQEAKLKVRMRKCHFNLMNKTYELNPKRMGH